MSLRQTRSCNILEEAVGQIVKPCALRVFNSVDAGHERFARMHRLLVQGLFLSVTVRRVRPFDSATDRLLAIGFASPSAPVPLADSE